MATERTTPGRARKTATSKTGSGKAATGKNSSVAPGRGASSLSRTGRQRPTASAQGSSNGTRASSALGAQTFAHAQALLEEVLRFEAAADGIVSRFFKSFPQLGQSMRGVVAESIYTVLRQRSVYGQLAQSGVGPFARRMLLLALHDQGFALGGIVNDIEREWLQRIARFDRTVLPAMVRSNLPEWLWNVLVSRMGEAETLELAYDLNRTAPLDVRVNRVKSDRDKVLARLDADGALFAARPTPFAPDGVRFLNKPPIHRHPMFDDGSIEVQDEGSQLLAHLLAPKRGEMVVDFCAGAGGKTLALGALMRNTGRLYAFDVSAKRLERFAPRLARSGLSNVHPAVIVSENDSKIKRLAGKIDRVLVDAPCSGLGTLRRNPDLKWRQSPESVREMNVKQASILASASRLVKPGGRLVYATCSLLDEENSGIVRGFLEAHPEFELRPVAQELARLHIELDTGEYLQLLPHKHGTDGFFAAMFERKA
jgi:16S rRNA (cytosine967-C5)-methyltransferase